MLTVWANQDQQYYYNVIKAVAESSRFDLLHLTLQADDRCSRTYLCFRPVVPLLCVCSTLSTSVVPRHRRHQIPVGLLLLHELIAFAIAAPFWSFWSFHPSLPPAEHLWSVPSGLLERDGYRWRSGCLGRCSWAAARGQNGEELPSMRELIVLISFIVWWMLSFWTQLDLFDFCFPSWVIIWYIKGKMYQNYINIFQSQMSLRHIPDVEKINQLLCLWSDSVDVCNKLCQERCFATSKRFKAFSHFNYSLIIQFIGLLAKSVSIGYLFGM